MLITAVALQLSGRRVWVKDDSVCGKDTVRIKDVKTGQLPLKMWEANALALVVPGDLLFFVAQCV